MRVFTVAILTVESTDNTFTQGGSARCGVQRNGVVVLNGETVVVLAVIVAEAVGLTVVMFPAIVLKV